MNKEELIKGFAEQILIYKKHSDRAYTIGENSTGSYHMGQVQAIYDVARTQFDVWNFEIDRYICEKLNK